jgi:phosphoserine phosphatase RsbX
VPGQRASGDRPLVQRCRDGALVAAVDGIGHGEQAAAAASKAITLLERHADEPVVALLRRCHESLRDTRGAVISLASFDWHKRTMTWAGVGNVEGLLLRANANATLKRESLLVRAGVVGRLLPTLAATIVPVLPGDTLILATDGIERTFTEAVSMAESPQAIADRIVAMHARGTDDALVIVARYVVNRVS